MKNKNIKVSVIIVNYKVDQELLDSISSIVGLKPKVSYEIIVVDNYGKSNFNHFLKKRFPFVMYVKSSSNLGYGGANNLGSKQAKGEFLFFLNPDTIVKKYALDILYKFILKNNNAGMVAPLLYDPKGNVYPSQGSQDYSLLNAVIVQSFVNKIFPNNYISKKFFQKSWNKKDVKEFDVVPGTAFMIKKDVFEKAGKFDENFFLYFEEYDLAKRIKKSGYKNYIIPESKIIHIWEASTKKSNLNLKNVFKKSRFYYFKKHFGILPAYVVELFASFGKKQLFLGLALAIGAFLRFYKLDKSLPFIGDYGWFYLSARDMILNSEIPLVGITSSHTWLHQGPFWTYILGVLLWFFNFNPLSGGVFVAIVGVFTTFLVYKIAEKMFSSEVGLISAFLYSISPLIVAHSRTPYHTSPIPFFALLLFFSIYKWIKGKKLFFPISILLLQILYNFELATQVLWGVFLVILFFGVWKRKTWAINLFKTKIISFSIFAFIVPMIPVLIYDFSHGFSQTIKFLLWIPYRILKHLNLLGNLTPNAQEESILSTLLFFMEFYQKLIFASSEFLSFFIFIISLMVVFFYIYKKKYSLSLPIVLIILFMLIPIFGFLVNKTPSEAYLPILFPTGIIFTGWAIEKIIKIKQVKIFAILLLLTIVISNSVFVIININNDFSFFNRLRAAQEIIKKSEGKNYNLIGKGRGSEFESFTMNYEYLTWWLGHGPSEKNENLKIYISETNKGVMIEKNEN